MPKRLVGEGESTSSLAKKKGFYWKTIWEHGENAERRPGCGCDAGKKQRSVATFGRPGRGG